MSRKKIIFILFLLFISFLGNTQPGTSKSDTALVNDLNQQSKDNFAIDPNKSIELATQARDLAEKNNFFIGKAYALKNIGLGYYFQGKYVEALEYWQESLGIFEEINDQTGIANLLNNIAAIYAERGDDEHALEFSLRSLHISEKLGDKLRILSALNTVGSIYNNKAATKDKALNYLLQALPLCEAIGNTDAFGTISENIGEIYFDKGEFEKAVNYFEQSIKATGNTANSAFAYNGIGKVNLKKGNFSKALEYHNKALSIAELYNSKPNIVGSLGGIANVYIAEKNFNTALNYYNKAIAIAEELKAAQELKDLYQETSLAYSNISDYKNAYKYKSLYADIKDTLYNIDADKKLGRLQFEFDLQKKQAEINLLTKNKDLADLKLKRQKFAKTVFIAGFGLVLLVALLVYRNYRAKVKTHKILDRQKAEIENLVLNILPAEVAKELQENGKAIPRNYQLASVMFADFKGFTLLADKLSPQELVKELNICFIAFDEIIEKYKLEKIKTIGDSYMCAGGIPTPNEEHVENMIKASLEIKDFIHEYNQKRVSAGLEAWELRIGIHVGPIVAGVVGKKKYAYDIWGNTVNIASRMESNGVPGQVNISSTTYQLIKDKYNCSYRGKIQAKNIGEIDMYLVESGTGISNRSILLESFEKDKTMEQLSKF